MNFQKIGLIIGIIGILVLLWLLFAPVNDISKGLQPIVDNATDNITPFTTADGQLETFNAFQDAVVSGLWFIIAGGIVVAAILIIGSGNNSNPEL